MKEWFMFWWPWIQGCLGMAMMWIGYHSSNGYLLAFGGVMMIAGELSEIRRQIHLGRIAKVTISVVQAEQEQDTRVN